MDEPTTLLVSRDPEREAKQRALLVNALRVLLLILLSVIIALGIFPENAADARDRPVPSEFWPVLLGFGGIFFAAIILVDVLTPRRKLSSLSAIIFGVFAGVILTVAAGVIIDYLREAFFSGASNTERYDSVFATIKLSLGVGLCYLGASTILQTQDDFRLVIPYVEFAKQIRGPKPLVVDSSALIDGRVLALAEVGLVQVPLVVPGFVIDELQLLSDADDKLKRNRGRRGLDILSKLQKHGRLDVSIETKPVPGKDVDQKLIELARTMPGVVMTTDSGLVRVAGVQGVDALNLHDVANALKPSVIPGEPLQVHVIKEGEQAGQGVGYLDDGTMVVAENGGGFIGRNVELSVTSTMQTSAGRLIFGRVRTDLSVGDDDGGVDGAAEGRVSGRGSGRG